MVIVGNVRAIFIPYYCLLLLAKLCSAQRGCIFE